MADKPKMIPNEEADRLVGKGDQPPIPDENGMVDIDQWNEYELRAGKRPEEVGKNRKKQKNNKSRVLYDNPRSPKSDD